MSFSFCGGYGQCKSLHPTSSTHEFAHLMTLLKGKMNEHHDRILNQHIPGISYFIRATSLEIIYKHGNQGPVVKSIISLTKLKDADSLSFTVLT